MPRKKRSEMSFSEMLQDTIDKHKKRQERSIAMFRAEQKRQGKKPDEPISLMDMIK